MEGAAPDSLDVFITNPIKVSSSIQTETIRGFTVAGNNGQTMGLRPAAAPHGRTTRTKLLHSAIMFASLGTGCEGVACAIPIAFPQFSAAFARMLHFPPVLLQLLGVPAALIACVTFTILFLAYLKRHSDGVHMVSSLTLNVYNVLRWRI